MNKQIRRLLFLMILIFSSNLAKTQDTGTISLREALEEAERSLDVTFSYSDEVIREKTVSHPVDTSSISAFLNQVYRQTGLSYQILQQDYITLSLPDSDPPRYCGTMRDQITYEPIENAIIRAGEQIIYSDSSGFFEFTEPPSSTIIFYHIGYKTLRKEPTTLPGQRCINYELQPQFSKLEAVEITNYFTRGIDKRIDGKFAVQPGYISLIPGMIEPDVLFLIQALPGIQSISESVSNLNIRGGTNDQNLMLWDDIRMFQSGHFYGLISAFNPYFTEEVRLIKNGTSASLGKSVSGTIEMESLQNPAEELEASLGVNLLDVDGYIHLPLTSKSSISMAGRRSVSDVAATPTYTNYFERAFRFSEVSQTSRLTSIFDSEESFNFSDISAKWIYKPSPGDKLQVSLISIDNTLEHEESGIINGNPESRTSTLQQASAGVNVSYSKLWSKKVRTNFSSYVSRYNLKAINYDIRAGQRLRQENEVLDLSIRADVRYTFSNKLDLLAGYAASETGISNLEVLNRPSFRRDIKDVITTHNLFSEVSFTSQDQKTNLRAGLRASYFEELQKSRIEPRLSFNQQLSERFSFELLGELKNQVSSQIIDLQTDFLGVEQRRWVLSNGDDIPVMFSKQLSVGLHYNHKGLLFSVEPYLKKVDGIITSGQGFLNQFELIRSSGGYEIRGIDMLVSKQFEQASFWVSYSLSENNYRFPDLTFQEFPSNLDVRHYINTGSNYEIGQFDIAAGVNWHSGRPFTSPVETETGDRVTDGRINYEAPNSSRLKNYLRLDASVTYELKVSEKVKTIIGASAWNVLNRENIINRYYRVDGDGSVQQFDQKALSFTPNFLLRFKFN